MDTRKTLNVVSWAGVALIVLDWVDVVPSSVGWIGFVMVVACFVLQLVQNRRGRP